MIKFTATSGTQRILGLGLSRENINKLLDGKPILVWASEVNETAFEQVFLMTGETEQSYTMS
jgi:hypothetical protein